jgi:rod shape-determining protein MreB and related proteins
MPRNGYGRSGMGVGLFARGRGARPLAVDLGTANTVVFRRGDGIVVFEPSVVAIDELTGQVAAVGADARRMIGRTPAHIRATRPLRHGVITDVETTEAMLRHFIRQGAERSLRKPDVIVCVPGGVTQVERSAVEEATLAAGAARFLFIEEPLAAAIGAGLPVADPVGSRIVDIGGGTSEIAVTALGGLVVSRSLRVGGYDLDDALVRLLQQRERLLIGQEQAEQVKLDIGSALPGFAKAAETQVAGRDLSTGLLRRASVTAEAAQAALARPLAEITNAVRDVLDQTPEELAADLGRNGLTLVGGGALLPGLDRLLQQQTGLDVAIDTDPLTTVARGAGQALNQTRRLQLREPTRRRRRREVRNPSGDRQWR